MKKNILEDLKFRGLIHQSTDIDELEKRLENSIVLYAGFDPTSDSLHVGNLLQIVLLKRFENYGHKPLALVGGATGLIGDPSGRSTERQLNEDGIVKNWSKKIKNQLGKFLDFDNKSELVNNYDWLGNLNIIHFLRDVGKNFSVNSMIAKESVKARLEAGISFTEFSYQILQSYDYLNLFKTKNCVLQIGGSDQWGNITAGVDLVRRVEGKQVFGLTAPLITKPDGTKFGKTAGGAVWLDSKKTSPYNFYQFWINVSDEQVVQLLKFFTFLSYDEINRLEKEVKNNPAEREAQKVLASELTKFVHGEDNLEKAKKISEILFSGDIEKLNKDELEQAFGGVPSYDLDVSEINLIDLLKEAEIVSSKRQAREDVQNGAIYVNGKVEDGLDKIITKDDRMHDKYLIIRRGKKKYFLIKWN
jgi:tyrosyl-tRNA synthetase